MPVPRWDLKTWLVMVWAVPVLVAMVGFLVYLGHTAVVLVTGLARGIPTDELEMTDPLALTVSVVLALTFVALVWGSGRDAARRRAALQAWALEHGWTYTRSSSLLVGRWDAAPFRAHNRSASDVLVRDAAVPLTSFTHAGGATRHVVMASTQMSVPPLSLTPHRGPHVGQDVVLESAAFNDRWQVQCPDTRFVHDVLHPGLMERLMRPDMAGLAVLVEGGDVVVHAAGRTDVTRIEQMAEVVEALLAALPRHVPADNPPMSSRLSRRQALAFRRARAAGMRGRAVWTDATTAPGGGAG